MNSGKVVLSVLAGAAIGAVTGILLAPDKGSVTRKNISDKSDAYAQKLNKKYKGVVDGLTQKFESMTHEAGAMAENGADKVIGGIDQIARNKRV